MSDSSMLSVPLALVVDLFGDVAGICPNLVTVLVAIAMSVLTYWNWELGPAPEQSGVHEEQEDHAADVQVQIVNLVDRERQD